MRNEVIEQIKSELIQKLRWYLISEGVQLYIAANDNYPPDMAPVTLEPIIATPLPTTKLLTEIKVTLRVLGKSKEMDALIEGIYLCLCPHQLTLPELTVILMSMHVENIRLIRPACAERKTVLSYIFEQESV